MFCTITLIRWLRPNEEDKIEERRTKLLADMTSAQDRLKDYHFNPQLLRQLLYDLEKRGSVFSPYVLGLLNKRIKRA